MADHGVFVSQQATSVSTPVLADSGIPFAIGTAPVQSAAAPGKAGIPVLCTLGDLLSVRSDVFPLQTLCLPAADPV